VILNFLLKVFERFMVTIIVFQAILLIVSVFLRYVVNSPIVWADELTRYSLIWMTFAGVALATKDNKHIVVDILDLALPPLGIKIVNKISDSIVIAFMIFLFYFGIKMTIFQTGMFGETLTWFSYAYAYVSIPIGAAFTILIIITRWFKHEEGVSNQNEVV